MIIQSLSFSSFDAPLRIFDILESIRADIVMLHDVFFVYVPWDCNATAYWIAGLARRRGFSLFCQRISLSS